MLTSVSIEWLWLMAAAATVVNYAYTAYWVPLWDLRLVYLVILAVMAGSAVASGGAAGIALGDMLVLYSFSLIGLTIGTFPSRRMLVIWFIEKWEGGTGEEHRYPLSHLIFCIATIVTMALAAIALTR